MATSCIAVQTMKLAFFAMESFILLQMYSHVGTDGSDSFGMYH
jgi:hypothetical protein